MFLKYMCFICFGMILLFAGPIHAEEVDPGKLLYENHCGACHTPEVHERANQKVNTLVDLSKMIIRWQYHLKLNWSVEEVRQVRQYLNNRYYNIDKRH